MKSAPSCAAEANAIVRATAAEAAYRAGWAACMQWASREPPAGLSDADTALWTAGWDDAVDAPFGAGPDVAELMRACPVFRGPHMTGSK